MKDSAGSINQVIVEKNKVRSLYVQFYTNGQLKAQLPISVSGKFDGDSLLFFSDGKIKSKGAYKDGFYIGSWSTYNKEGKLILLETYNSNGSLIQTQRY